MRRSFFPRVRREKLSSIRDNYLNAVGVAAQGANFSISAEMMRRILVDAARGWMRPGGGCGPGVDAARGWMRPGGGCGPGVDAAGGWMRPGARGSQKRGGGAAVVYVEDTAVLSPQPG
jgi:hypothetical protein